jgi:oxygen-independent coproporphyrinogen-3 oxidase
MSEPGGFHAPRWLDRTSDAGLGCYVHIPFCDRICPYCDFAVERYRESQVDRYASALLREIERSPRISALQTLYFGGGTPSALPLAVLQRICEAVFTHFSTHPGSIECTLEANPARNVDDLGAWRRLGVSRLSLGVQSFDDGELHRLGREHSSLEAIEFCRAAQRAGFTNVSLDLIAGAPGQTLAAFERSLKQAAELNVNHISVYGLTIEAGTPYAAWHARDPGAFPDDDALAELLDRAYDVLCAAGLVQYEISNFARAGYESAHNMGYWRQRDCVAFGLGAAGYESGVRYRNTRNFIAYCAALERGQSARVEEERLAADARVGEAAMLALRTGEGIVYEDFARRFGAHPASLFADAIKKCMAAGLLEVDARSARLTRRGRLLANTVCAEFLVPQRPPVVAR